MTASIINIAGQEWAVNLLWRTETGRKAKANAVRIAKEVGDDLMVTRPLPSANYGSSAIQVGLSSTRVLGKKAKSTPSLAAALASLREGSWLGAFELSPNHYFALAVKDDAILSSGDKLFVSEAELLQYINGQRKVAEWDYVLTSDVALEGAEPVDISRILVARRGKAPSLKSVGGSVGLPADMPVGRLIQIALIGAFAAVYFWPENKQPIGVPTQTKAPPPPPWPMQSAPSDQLEACVNAAAEAPIAVGGWFFSSVVCDGSIARIQMKRTQAGTFQDMLAIGASLLPDSTYAVLSRPITKAATPGSEPINDLGIKHRFMDAIEAQGDRVEINMAPPPLPGANPDQEPPTWSELVFKITTHGNPRSFMWLNNIPGARLSKIQYTPAETPPYKLEGIIYVKK